MSLKSIHPGKNNLSNEDAFKIIVQSIATVVVLVAAFGPWKFSIWGLMVLLNGAM